MSDWIEHDGSHEYPVDHDEAVEVKLYGDGDPMMWRNASDVMWHTVKSYRVIRGQNKVEKMSHVLGAGRAVTKQSSDSPLNTQEGGDHYKSMKIQPVEYITANKLGFIEGSVVKYVSRHRNKNGAEDVKKAIHFLNLLLELEYGDE